MKLVYGLLTAALLITTAATAQENKDSTKAKKKHSITIGSEGISIDNKNISDSIKEEKAFSVEIGVIDLGINGIKDNSIYGAATQPVLRYAYNSDETFAMRNGKSWNVNIWPVLTKFRLMKTKTQKIYFYTGVGLQVYNFRYSNNVSFDDSAGFYLDKVKFTKNKLCVTYLSVPLGFTLKTKLAEKAWLVYGASVTGGYRISSYMKQVSAERGKDKIHNDFYLRDFNSCVTAEIGIDGYFRLFGSYQLTALHEDASGLDQHPFTIGLRIGGI